MLENIKQLGKAIQSANNILVINHIRMDPDAFGSLSAFYYILKSIGKNVIAVNDELPPKSFRFLGANDIFQNHYDFQNNNIDLIISFDAANIEQLGDTYKKNENIFQETPFFVIDHHLSNPGFGRINIIDISASSTCEKVFEILEILKLTKYITPKIATLLTAGIHTDTNMFYNSNTTPKTLRIAAKLMELGADFRKPMFEFFKKKNFNKTRLWGNCLSTIRSTCSGKIVYGVITQEMFDQTNTTDADTSGLINEFLANIENSQVSFLIYPLKNGMNKVSFRSSGYNVSALCQKFGGGGHMQAAGFSTTKNISEITQEILDILYNDFTD